MPATLQRQTAASLVEPALEEQIAALEEKLRSLRGIASVRVVLPQLHDETTGRVDAQRVADYLGVPLKRLAEGLGFNYKTAHRNPDAESFQEALRPVKRSLEILDEFFRKPELVRAWLHTPHPDLDGSTAMDTILDNKAQAVCTILENALAGVPV